MALRCLLFSSDEGNAAPIRQVLTSLGVEGEYCPDPAVAGEKVAHENFQIVIVDWDHQPEAALLLSAARQRKAAERPLTLAIVSDDTSVPKALQAGANSILRKPILINQVSDTLTTARDLLRAKHEPAAAAAAASSSATSSSKPVAAEEMQVRPTEILESARTQFGSTSHAPEFVSGFEPTEATRPSNPISVAAKNPPVQPEEASEDDPGASGDAPRGLQWYLKQKVAGTAAAPAPAKAPAASGNPELMGFEQMTTAPAPREAAAPLPKPEPTSVAPATPAPNLRSSEERKREERKREAELFAYMADGAKPTGAPAPKSRLGKPVIITALVLAGIGIFAAPQAPWHRSLRSLWLHGQHSIRAWLSPPPVAPAQTPVAHEDFARAGDEYKLPAAEAIPDATTDPNQIQVLPAVDPTAKKPSDGTALVQPPPPPAGTTVVSPEVIPTTQPATPDKPVSSAAEPREPFSAPPSALTPAIAPPVQPSHVESQPSIPQSLSTPLSTYSTPGSPGTSQPAPVQPKNPPHYATTPSNVPSSLKSQLATTTPEMSGNKAPETAMAAIEPVSVTEATERALALEQAAPAYPATAKGQQGTVTLQVLVGRDGTVQDAKFVQGSLAFARAAIDGAKQWKFKPYIMNGRPVSVQTQMTITFKP